MTRDPERQNTPDLGELEPTLDAELRRRADGDSLRALYAAIPSPASTATSKSIDAAWSRLQQRVHDPARKPYDDELLPVLELVVDLAPGATSITTARRWPRTLAAVAATILVLLGGIGVWGATSVTHRVARGASPRAVRLPDGSDVWVASGSTIAHARRLAWGAWLQPDTRAIRLHGEAFFTVARDGRAFVVRTSDATVQVLGTRFNVRAESDGAGTRVQVEEGRVAVRSGTTQVQLGAGEGTRVAAAAFTVQRLSPQRVASWRTGGLAALDEPLREVLNELSRRYNVQISSGSDVNMTASVSLFYPVAPPVESVLRDLSTAQGLRFERTSRGYALRGAVDER